MGPEEIALTCCLVGGFAAGVFSRAFAAYSRAKLDDLVERHRRSDEEKVKRLIIVERAVRSAPEIALSSAVARDLFGLAFAVSATVAALEGDLSWGGLIRPVAVLIAVWVAVVGILARTIGANFAEEIVYRLGGVARLMLLPTRPFGMLILFGEKMIGRLRGKMEPESEEEEIEEEIRAIVAEGTMEGVLEREEGEMIESVLKFGDANVAEIMTPRTDMVSIPADASLKDVIRIAREAGHSRLPVHEGTRDNIIGIFYVKDLLHHWAEEKPPALKEILRKPHFIPESRKISGLLKELRATNVHIAIVLDEYGGTAGLVTVEDIVEEVVGEIKDEFDRTREPTWTRIGGADEVAIEVDARVHVDDVNEALGVKLPEAEDYDTVGGLVISLMGRIPRIGEKAQSSGVELEVLDADTRRVKSLRIRQVPEDEK